MRRRPRLALTLLLVPAVALPLSACTGPDRPPADDAAQTLAAALQAGKLDGVALQAPGSVDPQTQLTEIFAPLVDAAQGEDATATVKVASVGDVVEDGDDVTAPVTLAWTWPVARDTTWDYETTAELAYVPPADGSDDPGTWEVVWQPDVLVPELAAGERLDVEHLAADRADILDGAGEPLVTARDVWRIGVDKTQVDADAQDGAARELADLVGLDGDAYAAQVESAGEKAFVEAITIRQQDPGTSFSADDARAIPGVIALSDTMELAPTSDFAKPILGRSGEATAEIIEKSAGEVRAGDVVGLSGLQQAYDDTLSGTSGVVVRVVPASDGADDSADSADSADSGSEDGDEGREMFRVDPQDGTPVQTTLDVALQKEAEAVLDDVEPASAIVAIQPSTGNVLAAASGPGSEGWSTATLGKYAPGSTFKVVDGLAFQRAGLTADSTVSCPETITVDGRRFSNVPGYPALALGEVPLSTAFAHSCNTAMIGQRDTVSQEDLTTAAADLGLTDDEDVLAGVGAPAFLGSVPSEAGDTEHAASMIGQGKIEASPLGMATVAASVAAGKRVEPVLVEAPPASDAPASDAPADESGDPADESGEPSAEASSDASPAESSDAGVSEGEAKVLRELMHGVVTEGSADILQDIPGIVGAKTGTAQYGDGSQQHVWMLAIVDDLAVAVFVEDGYRGSATAGPIMHDFLTGL